MNKMTRKKVPEWNLKTMQSQWEESFGCKVKTDGMNTEEVLQSNRGNWGRCEGGTASLDRRMRLKFFYLFIKNSSAIAMKTPFWSRSGSCECVLLVFVLNEVLCCLWLFFCKAAIIVQSWNSRCPWPWWPAEAAWIVEVLESNQWTRGTCLASPDI